MLNNIFIRQSFPGEVRGAIFGILSFVVAVANLSITAAVGPANTSEPLDFVAITFTNTVRLAGLPTIRKRNFSMQVASGEQIS